VRPWEHVDKFHGDDHGPVRSADRQRSRLPAAFRDLHQSASWSPHTRPICERAREGTSRFRYRHQLPSYVIAGRNRETRSRSYPCCRLHGPAWRTNGALPPSPGRRPDRAPTLFSRRVLGVKGRVSSGKGAIQPSKVLRSGWVLSLRFPRRYLSRERGLSRSWQAEEMKMLEDALSSRRRKGRGA